jgi:hypothetical protein
VGNLLSSIARLVGKQAVHVPDCDTACPKQTAADDYVSHRRQPHGRETAVSSKSGSTAEDNNPTTPTAPASPSRRTNPPPNPTKFDLFRRGSHHTRSAGPYKSHDFRQKVAPLFRTTAQSGDRCRLERCGPTARGRPFTVTVPAHRTRVPSAAQPRRPPRLTAPLAQLACATPASALLCSWQVLPALCLPFACPRMARISRLLAPRTPDAPAHSLDPPDAPTSHSRSAGDVVH